MAESSEKEMPFLDHLEEVRRRLFYIIGAVLLGLMIGFTVSFQLPQVIDFITAPATSVLPREPDGSPSRLITTSPTGAFRFKMMLALYIALLLALPAILYQIWAFLAPGLYKEERKVVIPVLGAGAVLFLLGVTVAFKIALPITLSFLLGVGETNFELMWTIEAYFSLLMQLTLGFGVMFELPVVILALTALGIVTPQLLHKFRRYAIVILLGACALITPPELSSLFVMFVPVYLLYEISVVLSFILYRKKARAEAAASIGGRD